MSEFMLKDPKEITLLADERVLFDHVQERIYVDDKRVSDMSQQQTQVIGLLALTPDMYHQASVLVGPIYGDHPKRSKADIASLISRTRATFSDRFGIDGYALITARKGYGYSATTSLESPAAPTVEPMGERHYCADKRLAVDARTHLWVADGTVLQPSRMSFKLLEHLAANVDTTVASDELMADLNIDKIYNLKSLIENTRELLGPELGDPRTGVIKNVRGIGFMALSALPGGYEKKVVLSPQQRWFAAVYDETTLPRIASMSDLQRANVTERLGALYVSTPYASNTSPESRAANNSILQPFLNGGDYMAAASKVLKYPGTTEAHECVMRIARQLKKNQDADVLQSILSTKVEGEKASSAGSL